MSTCVQCGIDAEGVPTRRVNGKTYHINHNYCIRSLRMAYLSQRTDKEYLLSAIDRWWTNGDNNALIIARRSVD